MNSRGASIFGRIHWSERGSSRTVTIRHAVLSPPANGATAMPAGIAAALRCILLRYDAAEYPDRRDADRSRQMLLGRETFGHAERLPGDRESLNPVEHRPLFAGSLGSGHIHTNAVRRASQNRGAAVYAGILPGKTDDIRSPAPGSRAWPREYRSGVAMPTVHPRQEYDCGYSCSHEPYYWPRNCSTANGRHRSRPVLSYFRYSIRWSACNKRRMSKNSWTASLCLWKARNGIGLPSDMLLCSQRRLISAKVMRPAR